MLGIFARRESAGYLEGQGVDDRDLALGFDGNVDAGRQVSEMRIELVRSRFGVDVRGVDDRRHPRQEISLRRRALAKQGTDDREGRPDDGLRDALPKNYIESAEKLKSRDPARYGLIELP